ncbi:MAG: GAF domain-containing protein [Marinilabiliaceae bacterium]
MGQSSKVGRYQRMYDQIADLVQVTSSPWSRMSTIAAVLHHKMPSFFWTGFYYLDQGDLLVGPYQGPVACLKLAPDKGVCRACVDRQETVLVPDVEQFPGHIACSSQSRSEIVVPVRDHNGKVVSVLDVDSRDLNAFDQEDRSGLEKIVEWVYH